MLTRRAKTLNAAQVRAVLGHIESTQAPIRNRLIFLLSLRAGLRSKEIAELRWSMVTDPEGWIADVIRLPDSAAKGSSGGIIPMARDLRQAFTDWASGVGSFNPADRIVTTQRAKAASAQMIVNLMRDWYLTLGFDGCSSHSGRRTFITNAARNIGRFGGSLRDVQQLARHTSLTMTQAYIDVDSEAMRKVVDA